MSRHGVALKDGFLFWVALAGFAMILPFVTLGLKVKAWLEGKRGTEI